MKSRLIKIPLLIFLLSVFAILGFTAYQGKQLASPDRRVLQPYHYDWLDHPDQHGIHITETLQLDQLVPCLTVSPMPEANLGKRGLKIRAQLLERGIILPEPGQILGNLVLLHGRNGRKEDLLPVAERFCAIGLRCIIPDLPAHGDSPIETVKFGLGEIEINLPQRLLAECAKEQNFAPSPSALWGMSMGGCFATRSASNGGTWSSLVIVSSFDSLENTIVEKSQSQTLTNITSYFCRQNGGADISKVTPSQWAKSITIPTLVAHGTEDSLINMKAGENLYHHFGSEHKQWIEVPGGDHDNVLITPMPLYAEMGAWILKNIDPNTTTAPLSINQ